MESEGQQMKHWREYITKTYFNRYRTGTAEDLWEFVLNVRVKYSVIVYYLCRYEDDGESIRELESMTEMGQEFYAESGDLYKLVGVLRAADIYWNPEKR